MTTWIVRLRASGELVGTVDAFTFEEALGRAIVCVRMWNASKPTVLQVPPQALDVYPRSNRYA